MAVHPFPPKLIEPTSLPAGPEKVSAVSTAIKMLLAGLDENQRAAVMQEVWPEATDAPSSVGGPVLGAVVRLLPKQKAWTVAQLKEEVAAQGVKATAKELYNALGYLTRKKRITRVGYGQYLIDGEGLLVTADDLGIPPHRDECGDY